MHLVRTLERRLPTEGRRPVSPPSRLAAVLLGRELSLHLCCALSLALKAQPLLVRNDTTASNSCIKLPPFCVQVLGIAARLRDEHGDGITSPVAIVCISAKEGTGVQGISAALEPLLADCGGYDPY